MSKPKKKACMFIEIPDNCLECKFYQQTDMTIGDKRYDSYCPFEGKTFNIEETLDEYTHKYEPHRDCPLINAPSHEAGCYVCKNYTIKLDTQGNPLGGPICIKKLSLYRVCEGFEEEE